MSTSNIYTNLIIDIKKQAPQSSGQGAHYCGTPHKYYGMKTAMLRKIVDSYWPEIVELEYSEWIKLLDKFYGNDIFESKVVGGSLLRRSNKQRQQLELLKLSEWLEQLYGWAEIDVTCQSTFEAKELLGRWEEWQPFLQSLNKDKNISKRRASLVLMIKSLRSSTDEELEALAFVNVKNVMFEKDILITKAVSWILREMVKKHKKAVSDFVERYEKELPAIAVRETKRKIATGRK